MKGVSQNREIVAILETLKEVEKSYPPELMKARRKVFARHVTAVNKDNSMMEENRSYPSGKAVTRTTSIRVV